jgi:hypothetical protein
LQSVGVFSLHAGGAEHLADHPRALGEVVLGPVITRARVLVNKVTQVEEAPSSDVRKALITPGSRSKGNAQEIFLPPEAPS